LDVVEVVEVVVVGVVGAVALQTVMLSVAGNLTWVPADGLWDTTLPFCEGSQMLVVVEATVRP
jgi:hypothetical protein